jgi:hypothetical protein
MSPPKEHISGLIHPHQREQIEAIGGDRGISAGLRDVVTAGLLALRGDAALIAPIEELQTLAYQLARITGRTTPAGAIWAPTPEAMPQPSELDPTGAVVATPGAVGLLGDGAVVIDMKNGTITTNSGGHEISVPVELGDLVHPVALLPATLAGLAAAGPGRRELGLGLAVERTGDGLCRVTLQGVGVSATPQAAQTFAAELLGLIARATRQSAAARVALERQLQQEVTP